MPTTTAALSEHIAGLALATFKALPNKYKPRTFANGNREWTPMSAVILSHQPQPQVQSAEAVNDDYINLTCISLATGTKCLPHTALTSCYGTVVHDSHAEILALRGLNRWFLDEIRRVLESTGYESPFIVRNPRSQEIGDRPFRLKEEVSVHLFTTSTPCGDASMDLLVASRPGDNVPWAAQDPAQTSTSSTTEAPFPRVLHGHSNFSHSLLGHVRMKPSRADAPPTHSKSCTDKLALKQFIGVWGFPLDLLAQPAYLTSIVVPADAYHEHGWRRAFGREGRLKAISGRGAGNLRAQFFDVHNLPASFPEFDFARSQDDSAKVSNIAAVYIHRPSFSTKPNSPETLINGVKQGFHQLATSPLKQSAVCRRAMWLAAQEAAEMSQREDAGPMANMLHEALAAKTYAAAKGCILRSDKRTMKEAVTRSLVGWIANTGDGEWMLG